MFHVKHAPDFAFAVTGDPLSWSRVQGRGGNKYKNPKLKNWQGLIREEFLQEVGIQGRHDEFPLAFPCFLVVEATFASPHWLRRDADNVLKAVMDALKGAAWHDDTFRWVRSVACSGASTAEAERAEGILVRFSWDKG
jgi:Holliday junction resolvase RusA-like endonuclease